ncbi:MAG: zinc-dependent metalloprotease, partial [Candidatus Bathyarchaeia archaeon]
MKDKDICGEAQTIEEFTEDMERYPGYFDFYWDENQGKVWLEIDKFDEKFLYLDSLTAGLGSNDVGLDRNQMGETRIVKFQRTGPKVLMIQPNYSFRAISENPYERKAVEEAFVTSVIWGFDVKVEEDKRVLVDATSFIIRDVKGVRRTLKEKEQGEYELDENRCVVFLPGTRNFPLNTEFEAVLTFRGKEPGKYIEQVAPNPHALTFRQHHSFVQLPDDDYEPRRYDIRSSFFGISYKDYASPVDEPLEKRYICRHRLRKRNPSAEVSEPVEPITYYVDRGVPEPIRGALIEGASWWNQAFESIGYKDAFRVELLPEDAHPLDIRYNVINWVHRSTRGWSYGMSVRDPRTGEIIKGNVALGSLRIRQDFLIAEGLVADYEEEDASEMLEMALARIRQLSVHEVGHTLGLGHNYASNVNGRASVMDYPAPLVKIDEGGSLDLSEAYEEGVGAWDKVSIAYGYQDLPPGLDEEEELDSILEEAFTGGLYFAPSQDAGPESANPLAASWVNGENALDEFERIMRVRKIALEVFGEEKIHIGRPMAELEEVLVPIYLLHRYQMEAAASVLGGIYYHHKVRGGVQKSPEFIPAEEQRRALN